MEMRVKPSFSSISFHVEIGDGDNFLLLNLPPWCCSQFSLLTSSIELSREEGYKKVGDSKEEPQLSN
jgi:hypothetical protein